MFLVFKAKELVLKHEMKEELEKGIPREDLLSFVMTEDNQHEFDWEHDKEFEYKGTMYDVVYKTIQEDGSVLLECIADDEESELFRQMDNYVAGSFIQQNNGKHPLVDFHTFLQQLFFQVEEDTKFVIGIAEVELTILNIVGYDSPKLEIPTAPPSIG